MRSLYAAIIAVTALLCTITAAAQIQRSFTPRYQLNARGAIYYVSNSILQSKLGGNMTAGTPNYSQSLTSTTNGTSTKNDKYMGSNIDVDSDPTTVNSSSADFTLPACGSIAFAGLYWGVGLALGQTGDGGTANTALSVPNWNTVKLKVPGSNTYATVTAGKMDTITTVFSGYQGFADVTSLVQAGAISGTYTVANVACDTNKWNTYGGWTLVMVYRDSTLPVHNLTVFDGISIVGNNAASTVDVSIAGFKAPATGTVNAVLGAMAYDGDRGATDGFSFKQNGTTNFIDLTSNSTANTTGLTNDAWNSSISYAGSDVATRNPHYTNTFGYDADIFNLYNPSNSYLRNNDSTATVRLSSNSETYVLGLVTTQLDNFFPEITAEARNIRPHDSLQLGDTIRFTTAVRNTGSDTATSVVFTDRLPATLKYIPNSMTLNGAAVTDAAGDDVGEYTVAGTMLTMRIGLNANSTTGGRLRSNKTDSAVVSYLVRVTTNCSDFPGGTTPALIVHQSGVSFAGQTNTNTDSVKSRPASASACPMPVAPDALYAKSGCSNGVALALQLLSFTLHQSTTGNELCWTVTNDGNNDAATYTLYHSTDGIHFEPIYLTAGTKEATSFCYTDATGNAGYYRLGVTEYGNTTYSKVLTALATTTGSNTTATCYPNPTTGRLTVSLPNSAACRSITILGADGRTLKEFTGNNQPDCSTLSPGIYLLRCTTADGAVYNVRMVKE